MPFRRLKIRRVSSLVLDMILSVNSMKAGVRNNTDVIRIDFQEFPPPPRRQSMQFNMENSLRPDSGSTPGDYSLQRVEYPEIWRGISAIYEARQGVVAESTFEVQPGADPENIRLRYNTRIPG